MLNETVETCSMDTQEPCFDRSIPLGELVVQHPAAAEVLKSFRIDFCCGGNRPFFEVVAEHGLSEQEVVEKLMTVCGQTVEEGEEINWRERSFSDLIDHIISDHHAYLYKTLPELAQYVLTIDNVHGSSHPELHRVRKLYAEMHKELMIHLPKEEQDMFPAIKKLEQELTRENLTECQQMVGGLGEEHESCGDILKEIRHLTDDYALPEDACSTYQHTFHKLQELESDLFQHIHLENNILFPRVMGIVV